MTPGKKGRDNSPSRKPRSKRELSFTKPVMTREEIKSTGEMAAQMLNSPIYNLAVNSVVEDLGMEILQTAPHETQKREWLYSQGAAIGRINQKMVEFVNMAQSLHERELAAEEAAQRENDANQGFGALD